MTERRIKEELNTDKLINFLHKYNYNYKALSIDITNKNDNYVILEINIINNDDKNIIKKKYKKYIKKYNRKKPISSKSLTNLKNMKICNNDFIEKKQNHKIISRNNNLEQEIGKLKISNKDLLKNEENKEQINEYKIIFKDDKIKDNIKNDNINITEKVNFHLQQKIINNYELDIYNFNNNIKKIKEYINLKKINIINGTLWRPKDVYFLLQEVLNKINIILMEYNPSISSNNKNICVNCLFMVKKI